MNEPKVIASYAQSRKTHGLTDNELAEAMFMFTEHKASEAVKQVIDEFDTEHNHTMGDDLLPIVQFFMKRAFDKGFTEGMTLGGDTYSLVTFYKEAKKRSAASLVKDYEFEKGKGVSGVLFPDGTFQKCGNAEHYMVLEEYPLEQRCTLLYFSSTMRSDGDGVISHSPVNFYGVTYDMTRWMENNFRYFDRGQKRRAQELTKGGILSGD